jgi:hypothetical protein
MSRFTHLFNYLGLLEVEPQIPLLRHDLKVAACANINSYFRLSNNIIKVKKLMEQHAYIYALRFDVSSVSVHSSA